MPPTPEGDALAQALRARLQTALEGAWPQRQGLRVGPLANITSGWESDLYAFTLHDAGAQAQHQIRSEALVLRLHAGESAARKAGHEARSLSLLAQQGYPVPKVRLALTDAAVLGRPGLILERIAGEPMWDLLSRAHGMEAAALVDDFGRLFAALHRLDWRPFAALYAPGPWDRPDPSAAQAWAERVAADPFAFADRTLAEGKQLVTAYPQLELEPVLAWLSARRDSAACASPAVVHRDFHPANVLLRAQAGGPVVIDWTAAAVADPREDLAWTLLLAGSYAGAEAEAGIRAAYERHRGEAVEGLDWFEVVACARRLSDVAISLSAGAEQRGMRAGATDMMRAQLGAVRHAAQRLELRTGLRAPGVERWLT
jgi:aminoglycoside phosphotransferase (APT) family kinase protein